MTAKIKMVLEIVYPAIYQGIVVMVVTRTEDGITTSGIVSGGVDNPIAAVKELTGGDWGNFIYTTKEIKTREFNRLVKGLDYLGCTPDDINPKIIERLGPVISQ